LNELKEQAAFMRLLREVHRSRYYGCTDGPRGKRSTAEYKALHKGKLEGMLLCVALTKLKPDHRRVLRDAIEEAANDIHEGI
jgi:hypothetical protein